MNITDNLKSVLIIDDDYNEVKDFEDILKQEGVYFSYYSPEQIDHNQKKNKESPDNLYRFNADRWKYY